ncbi:MAG: hypothetical protein ACFB02_00740 [Mastigocoleus sp.]
MPGKGRQGKQRKRFAESVVADWKQGGETTFSFHEQPRKIPWVNY